MILFKALLRVADGQLPQAQALQAEMAKGGGIESIVVQEFLEAAKAQPAFSLTKIRWASEVARIIDEIDPPAIRDSPLPGT